MKKFIISLICVLASALTISAATITTTVAANTTSNLLTSFTPGATITAISVTSSTTNIAKVAIVDSPTATTSYTNAAFVYKYSYATNLPYSWINYFGATNTYTNKVMVTVSATNAAAAYNYPINAIISVDTNSVTSMTGVNYTFWNGVWATTDTNGPAVVTITYTQ